MELAQLFLPERGIAAFKGEDIVVGGAGEVGDDHAVLNAFLEVDVFVEGDVGPEVHELDLGVGRADAVDAAESLDDPYRVPMNVVVDEIVTVLQVLAFADDVGADQHIEFAGVFGHGEVALLGLRREQRQDLLEVVAGPQRCFRGVGAAGDQRGV